MTERKTGKRQLELEINSQIGEKNEINTWKLRDGQKHSEENTTKAEVNS